MDRPPQPPNQSAAEKASAAASEASRRQTSPAPPEPLAIPTGGDGRPGQEPWVEEVDVWWVPTLDAPCCSALWFALS